MKIEDVRVGTLVRRRGDPAWAVVGEVVGIEASGRAIVRWELESQEWAYKAEELEPVEEET